MSKTRLLAGLAAGSILFGGALAIAQTPTPAPNPQTTPIPSSRVTVECQAFVHNPLDGSWTVVRPTAVSVDGVSFIHLTPPATFRNNPGSPLAGVNIGAVLDAAC